MLRLKAKFSASFATGNTRLDLRRALSDTAFEKLYLGDGLGDSTYKGIEGLWVMVSGNESLANKKGGVQELQCRWGSRGTGFACWLYDTDKPEGSLDRYDLEGDGEPNDPAYRTVMVCPNGAKTCKEKEKVPKLLCPNGAETCPDEDKIKVRYKFRSPLAARFMSFTDSGLRFAVFPESFTGGSVTRIKHVPVGSLVRDLVDKKPPVDTWSDDAYAGQRLYVRVCPPLGNGPPDANVCVWADSTATGFKQRISGRFPPGVS